MKVRKLKEQLKETQQELYDLHLDEPSQVYYKKRREELEYAIVALEDEIIFEKQMLPLKLALIGFVVASLGLFVYAYAATPY
jgi:hypothetical protein